MKEEIRHLKARIESLEKNFQNNMSDHWRIISDLVLTLKDLEEKVKKNDE